METCLRMMFVKFRYRLGNPATLTRSYHPRGERRKTVVAVLFR
jgi:hypothetical protein